VKGRGEVKTTTIARRHGVSRQTAYRWLRDLEKAHGPAIVARRGKRGVFVTTEDAFSKAAPIVEDHSEEDRRYTEIFERINDLETRCDKLASRVSELERKLAARGR
jgi:transposase-like protein